MKIKEVVSKMEKRIKMKIHGRRNEADTKPMAHFEFEKWGKKRKPKGGLKEN